MHSAQIVVIAMMVGAVAAGLTWFGWDLCQNLRVVVRNAAARRKAKAEADAAAQKKREAAEADARSEAKPQR